MIRHVRDTQGNVVSPSYLRYTCDEFPPATWIEGGSGDANLLQPAETRCAAYRCPGTAGMKIYGEQNWQARAHTRLRDTLNNVVNGQLGPGIWNPSTEPAAFWLDFINVPNSFPAQIIVATANGQILSQEDIPRSKRSILESVMNNMTTQERMAWMSSVGPFGLEEYGFQVTHQHILANDSFSPLEDAWYDDFDWRNNTTEPIVDVDWSSGLARPKVPKKHLVEKPVVVRNSTDNLSIRRRDAPSNTPETTPLVKNATAADIAAARKLVDAAISQSGDMNRARFSNMARNHYSLKPGTKIGGSTVQRRLGKRDDTPPPLFQVTPELAAAAALVAEADALVMSENSTSIAVNGTITAQEKRAIIDRAIGTFWMETIDRKGTVPWGNNATYKVSKLTLWGKGCRFMK